MKAPKSSGGPPPTSAPKSSIRFWNDGVLSTALTSALSLSTIGRGVPAGTEMPYQDEACTPVRPSSSKVGTSGRDGLRDLEATASARSLPLEMNGRQVVVSSISETWP